jgi:hypothetical protein
LHVLAAINRDIGAGHERRPVRAQVDDKTCNFFGRAESSERDLRQDLSWDSPDDSRTGVNIIAFPSSLEDRRKVRTATGTLGQPERWSSGRSGHFPWHWHGSIRRDCLDQADAGCCKLDRKRNSVQFSQISATIAASALAENVFWVPKEARRSHLQANAKHSIGKLIDEAMAAIEVANPGLKGVLPKDYNRRALDKVMLGEL